MCSSSNAYLRGPSGAGNIIIGASVLSSVNCVSKQCNCLRKDGGFPANLQPGTGRFPSFEHNTSVPNNNETLPANGVDVGSPIQVLRSAF